MGPKVCELFVFDVAFEAGDVLIQGWFATAPRTAIIQISIGQ